MVTWANRLMFYIRYMHQNINPLLNKEPNLCLYDQTICYHWILATQSVVIHEKHQKTRRDLRSTVEWCIQPPAMHAEVWVPQSALSKSGFWSCRQTVHHRKRLPLIITLNLHLNLFLWTLCCAQLTAIETHFPSSYLLPTFRKTPLLRKST